MLKRYMLIIILVIAIVGSFCLYSSSLSSEVSTGVSAEVLKVGSSEISLPEGYHLDKVSNHGGSISNNKNGKITIYYSDQSTQEDIDDYIEKHKDDNILNETSMFDDVEVHKFILLNNETNKTQITHFYFDKNGTPYHIFMKGDHDDSVISTIINNLN